MGRVLVCGDPRGVSWEQEQQTPEEIETGPGCVPPVPPATRGPPDQEENSGDGDIDDHRVDGRADGVAQELGRSVDDVGHAETDGETPLNSGRAEDRIQDGRPADPVEPCATRTAALEKLETD